MTKPNQAWRKPAPCGALTAWSTRPGQSPQWLWLRQCDALCFEAWLLPSMRTYSFVNSSSRKNFLKQLYTTYPLRMHSVFTEFYDHPTAHLEHFYHLQKKKPFTYPWAIILHPATRLHPSAKNNLLFESVDLPILDFDMTGIMRWVFFCNWHLSLNMFSRFFQVVGCICTPFLLTAR